MNSGRKIQNRILLLMKYSLNETYSENLSKITEQAGGVWAGTPGSPSPYMDSSEGLKELKYPEYCKYPKKALDDKTYVIESYSGYCKYPAVIPYNRDKKNVGQELWIPQDATLTFWDIPLKNEFVNQIWESWYEPGTKGKIKGSSKKELINDIGLIFPVGTVATISFNGQNYQPRVEFSTGVDNLSDKLQTKGWVFKGYYRQDGLPYTQPPFIETRTRRQKIVDDYGTYIQWGVVLGTILVTMASRGSATALWLEVLAELGVGSLLFQRELEKGENVSATFSLITGFLPMLKFTKWFRGVDPKLFDELAEELASTTFRTEEEILQFYNSLTPNKQKLFSQIFLQDEISENILKDLVSYLKTVDNINLPKSSLDDFYKLIQDTVRNNPEVFENLKFWDKLWARELTSNVVVGLLDLATDLTLGRYLNDEEKQNIEWYYVRIPEEHQKEFIYNVANNPEAIEGITKHFSESRDETIEAMAEWVNTVTKHEIEKVGGEYIEFPSDTTRGTESIPDSSVELEKMKTQGWVEEKDLNKRQWDSVKFVGDILLYKLKPIVPEKK